MTNRGHIPAEIASVAARDNEATQWEAESMRRIAQEALA